VSEPYAKFSMLSVPFIEFIRSTSLEEEVDEKFPMIVVSKRLYVPLFKSIPGR
jgi:hypothetical protein